MRGDDGLSEGLKKGKSTLIWLTRAHPGCSNCVCAKRNTHSQPTFRCLPTRFRNVVATFYRVNQLVGMDNDALNSAFSSVTLMTWSICPTTGLWGRGAINMIPQFSHAPYFEQVTTCFSSFRKVFKILKKNVNYNLFPWSKFMLCRMAKMSPKC